MDIVWVKCSNGNDLLYLCDTNLSCCSCILIEVSCRLSELKVSVFISSPCFDQSIITNDGILEEEILSVEILNLSRWGLNLNCLAISLVLDSKSSLLEYGSNSSWCVEPWDSCTTSSQLFCQSSLRDQLKLEQAIKVLSFELLVLTDI